MAKKTSFFEDLFKLANALPWWAGVCLALFSYILLHRFAITEVATSVAPSQLGNMVVGQMVKTLSSILQYIIPLALIAGAIASFLGKKKRIQLASEVINCSDNHALKGMSWHNFELLVGQAFRMQGYAVTETGGSGADGGVDLKLKRGQEIFLVQCKQWQAYKVSVSIVRELYGVMAAQGAAGGFVVTSGVFTADAMAFARGKNITLLDGKKLSAMLKDTQVAAHQDVKNFAPTLTEVHCPKCGSNMTKRVAKQGAHAGKAFWGCSQFPKCTGIRSI